MKIKNIILLFVLAGSAVFSGCSDWLDVQPKDKQTEQQLFATKSGFYSALNGIYVSMGSDALYGKNMSYEMLDVLAQRYKVSAKNNYYTQLVACNYSDKSVTTQLQATWEKAYKVILNCNVILRNLEEGRGTVLNEMEYKCLKGELLGVRAFLHFDMLRMFGPVYKRNPKDISIPYNEFSVNQVLPLLPADSVVNHKIMRDINEAEELLLASDPVIENGVQNAILNDNSDNSQRYRQLRLNYYAVLLLKARVLLYANDAPNALLAARKLIEDPAVLEHFPAVDPSRLLANNTNPDRMFSSECLFGIYNKDRGLIYRDRFNGESAGDNILQPRDGYVTNNLFGSETADYRYQSQWSPSTAVGMPGHMLLKYKQIEDPDNLYFYGTFCSLMKLSEAWYIAAEAETDVKTACDYVNVVRQRRGVPNVNLTSKAQVTTKLRNEYIREFIGEGQIFFLYKRLFVSMPFSENGVKTGAFAPTEAKYVLPLPESETSNR